MPTLDELLQQQQQLEQKIKEVRGQERTDVIKEMREQVRKYALRPVDLFPYSPGSGNLKGKLPPKYRDPETGKTWSGKGRAPDWIKGRDYEQFRIDAA